MKAATNIELQSATNIELQSAKESELHSVPATFGQHNTDGLWWTLAPVPSRSGVVVPQPLQVTRPQNMVATCCHHDWQKSTTKFDSTETASDSTTGGLPPTRYRLARRVVSCHPVTVARSSLNHPAIPVGRATSHCTRLETTLRYFDESSGRVQSRQEVAYSTPNQPWSTTAWKQQHRGGVACDMGG